MLQRSQVPRLALAVGVLSLAPHPTPGQQNPDRIVVPASSLSSHWVLRARTPL